MSFKIIFFICLILIFSVVLTLCEFHSFPPLAADNLNKSSSFMNKIQESRKDFYDSAKKEWNYIEDKSSKIPTAGIHFLKDKWNYIENEMSSFCECKNFSCGCCVHWELDPIHLNSSICINMTYLPKDYGISLTMTVDKFTIYNETISARSPPPVCFGSPYVEDLADVCLKFYDLDADIHHLYGCAKIEARLKHIHIAEYNIGCFHLGHKLMPEVILLP